MPETLVLDPVSEDAANSPLTLTSGSYGLTEHKYPQPAIDPQWASSVSTEGSVLASQRYQNREISITVEVDCTANLTPLRTLQAKLTKLAREGGTLQRTMSDATVVVFDVLTADGYDPSFDQAWHLGNITTVSFSLTCKPFGRGTEQTLSSHAETTLPAVIFTETGIKGDVPATGRLIITNNSGSDQWWMGWAEQTLTYSSAATAALFIEAETLTVLSGGTLTTPPAGVTASGTGSNVIRGTTTLGVSSDGWTAVYSTKRVSDSLDQTHVGSYRVMARVYVPSSNTTDVSARLSYTSPSSPADITNSAVSLTPGFGGKDTKQDNWQLVDLGIVNLPVPVTGSLTWRGTVSLSGGFANVAYFDYMLLLPVETGTGEASGVVSSRPSGEVKVLDDFARANGTSLGTQTATLGGTWTTAGATTDYTHQSQLIQRATVTDVGARTGVLATAYTTTMVQAPIRVTAFDTTAYQGLIARYVDASNYLRVAFSGTQSLTAVAVVAGVSTTLATVTLDAARDANSWYYLRLLVNGAGNVWAWVYALDGSPEVQPTLAAGSSVLSANGTLASGKVGVIDSNPSATAITRNFDQVAGWTPTSDAALLTTKQVVVRGDSVIRQDSTGSFWAGVSRYEGDYLRVLPAGAEARTTRFVVVLSRGYPNAAGLTTAEGRNVLPDTAIDDVTAQVAYTPRYLVVPGA